VDCRPKFLHGVSRVTYTPVDDVSGVGDNAAYRVTLTGARYRTVEIYTTIKLR